MGMSFRVNSLVPQPLNLEVVQVLMVCVCRQFNIIINYLKYVACQPVAFLFLAPPSPALIKQIQSNFKSKFPLSN